MQTSRLQSVVLAALCIAAVGVSATTIESTLSTDPDDVIDIDPNWLPIAQDTLVDAKDEMESNAEPGGPSEAGASGDTQPSEGGERSDAGSEAAGGGVPDGPGGEVSREIADAAEQLGGGVDQAQESETGLLERLLDLLGPVLGVLIVLGALLLVFTLRRRFADRLAALFGRERHRDDDRPAWPPEDPDGDISRAWLAMVLRIEADLPRSRTPDEWAAAAVEAGMDPDAVETLTRTFTEVRYGDAAPTASRRQRAWANFERLRAAFDGGSK